VKRQLLFLIFFTVLENHLFAQSDSVYRAYIQKADSLYFKKAFLKSAEAFSAAFMYNNDRGLVKDRYNAACSWALSNNKDSAFYQLFRIAEKGNFKDYLNLTMDEDLKSLHEDERWKPLVKIVKLNFEINDRKR
jgi:hypothetical protein